MTKTNDREGKEEKIRRSRMKSDLLSDISNERKILIAINRFS